LAVASAIAFAISTAFPAGACIVKDTTRLPRIWGVLDVAIAAIVAVLGIAVVAIGEKRIDARATEAAYRVYRILIHGILAAIVIFFTLGDRVNWTSCLPGFAWRAWLLLYALPAWIVAARSQSRTP
jgi:cyanophycinase-like exopeptidase